MNEIQKKIAIIGSGVIAKTISQRAKELGIESHGFSINPNDVACNSFSVFHEINIFDINSIVEICQQIGISGVIATTELTIYPAAQIANILGLNGNPVNVAKDITNKSIVRDKVKNVKNLNQPKFWIYKDGDIPKIDIFPVIVKPIAAGGKRGVCVIDSPEKLFDAIQVALSFSKVKGVIIEEYLVGGIEYSVESLSFIGSNYVIQVTQKDTAGPPHCNELGHHQPADLNSEMRKNVESTISEMLASSGIINGPCHTEIKIINDKIYLIEINARPGGDHITFPLTELSTGYPFVSGIIWISIGEFDCHKPSSFEQNYCGIYFVTEETYYLKPIFDRCEDFPWCYKKNKVSEELSKIIFNDEDNLNYFIYYSRKEKPKIQ
ncbi:MAG: ATP-grasp domain-containing protein [Eubacteriales bacterium]|nr:ATP-grasp domain-containing protein [Eubacteriales bacterium]